MRKKDLSIIVQSQGSKAIKAIRRFKDNRIKSITIDETIILQGDVFLIVTIQLKSYQLIPIDLLRNLNKDLSNKDPKYIGLQV